MTQVLVAALGSGGLITAVLVAWIGSRKAKAGDRGTEERAAAEVKAPLTGSEVVHDVEAFRMAQQAMHLANNSRKDTEKLKVRLTEVEAELSKFRRSYLALYEWSQRIVYNWSTLRHEEESPELPPDIHHP